MGTSGSSLQRSNVSIRSSYQARLLELMVPEIQLKFVEEERGICWLKWLRSPGVELALGMAGSHFFSPSCICFFSLLESSSGRFFPWWKWDGFEKLQAYNLSSRKRRLLNSSIKSLGVKAHCLWLVDLGHMPMPRSGRCDALISQTCVTCPPLDRSTLSEMLGWWWVKVVSQKKGMGNGSGTDTKQ